VAAELRALGQQATVTVIPDAGHQVFLDQPAPFCAALLRELEPYYDGGGG
jgi:pimeloyl-ACP methyl ester carboxylesterase